MDQKRNWDFVKTKFENDGNQIANKNENWSVLSIFKTFMINLLKKVEFMLWLWLINKNYD